MDRLECPLCHSLAISPHWWGPAFRYGLASFVGFWVGLALLVVLGLLGQTRAGLLLWLGATLAPLFVFLLQHVARWPMRSYRRAWKCGACGHEWVETRAVHRPDGETKATSRAQPKGGADSPEGERTNHLPSRGDPGATPEGAD